MWDSRHRRTWARRRDRIGAAHGVSIRAWPLTACAAPQSGTLDVLFASKSWELVGKMMGARELIRPGLVRWSMAFLVACFLAIATAAQGRADEKGENQPLLKM